MDGRANSAKVVSENSKKLFVDHQTSPQSEGPGPASLCKVWWSTDNFFEFSDTTFAEFARCGAAVPATGRGGRPTVRNSIKRDCPGLSFGVTALKCEPWQFRTRN